MGLVTVAIMCTRGLVNAHLLKTDCVSIKPHGILGAAGISSFR